MRHQSYLSTKCSWLASTPGKFLSRGPITEKAGLEEGRKVTNSSQRRRRETMLHNSLTPLSLSLSRYFCRKCSHKMSGSHLQKLKGRRPDEASRAGMRLRLCESAQKQTKMRQYGVTDCAEETDIERGESNKCSACFRDNYRANISKMIELLSSKEKNSFI